MTIPRSLDDWLRFQETVHGQGIDLGLTRVRSVAERLGLLPFPPRAIIVAGTNGKGSTVACLAGAAARAQASAPGASPRRICCAITSASASMAPEAGDAELIAAFEAIDAARGAITLTFFEYNALAALLVFRSRKRGMGGARSGAGRTARCREHRGCRWRRCLLHRARSCRLAGHGHRADRPREGGVFRTRALAVIADPDMTPSVRKRGAAYRCTRIEGATRITAGRSLMQQGRGAGAMPLRHSRA